MVEEAESKKVPVSDVLKSRKFDSWAAFADSCDQFPLTCRLMDFSELGAGWVLYFYVLRFMIAVMLLFVLANIPVIFTYATYGNLKEWSDPLTYEALIEGRNHEARPVGQQDVRPVTWLSRLSPGSLGPWGASPGLVPFCYALAMWVLAVMIVYMYALIQKIDDTVDLETTHPNDFAVLVEGLPPSAKEESDIREFFQKNAIKGRPNVEVVKVVIGWNLTQFEKAAKQLKALREERRALRAKGDSCDEVTKRIEALEKSLDTRGGVGELKSSGIAIVVFRQQADQVACLRRWDGFMQRWFNRTPGGGGWFSLMTGDAEHLPKFEVGGVPLYPLKVSRAPNPTDINWRDVGRSYTEFVVRKLATIISLFILLGVSYISVLLLTREPRQARRVTPQMNREYLVSLTMNSLIPATAITIINVLLMVAARWFGEREVHLTKTGEAAAINYYMTVAMILNAAVILWNISLRPPDWFVAGGLVNDMYAMLALNFIFPPLMFLMDYEFAMNFFFRRRLTEEKIQELNQELDQYRDKEDPIDKDMFKYAEDKVRSWEVCFEPTIMDLPRHYANAEKTYFCCLIYAPLMPLAPLIGLVSLLFQYGNDKWMLLRYCRRPAIAHNAEAAIQALMRTKWVLPWLLPIMMIYFLNPCFDASGALSSGTILGLLPAIPLFLVPTKRLAHIFRCIMPQLATESHRRGSAQDTTTQDYYQAQHLWPKERKYHKTHFLYAGLPEDVNPENLAPGTADVQEGALMGEIVNWGRRRGHQGRRASRRDRLREREGFDRSAGSPRRGRMPSGVSGSPGSDARVAPEIIGVVADHDEVRAFGPGIKAAPAVWEFEAGTGWKPFGDDCQDEVEKLYQSFCSGGSRRIEVKTQGMSVSLDFQKMTSLVVGGRTVRKMRRSTSDTE